MLDFILAHQADLRRIALLAAVFTLAGVLLIPWVVGRLPVNYFSTKRQPAAGSSGVAVRLGKNALGALFLVAGLMMLALPGPGFLAMLIGVGLIEFPGKRRVLSALARRPAVLNPLNFMRQRQGVAPLKVCS